MLLPLAERELRVASRRPGTFWARMIAAMVALVLGAGFLVLAEVVPGADPSSFGRGLFGVLTWMGLAVAMSAGLFFTSDCLSEEKRDGTLGLLFLTDLRGYDVVFGKLLATSLRSVGALLAVFPILAVTLLMGGVGGAQFWMTTLALLNALVVSLAAGLFVSAISRHSQRAMAATLALLVAWAAAGPAGDELAAAFKPGSSEAGFSLASPVYLFLLAGSPGPAPFWLGLAVNLVIAGLLLGATCWLVPRACQERVRAQPATAARSAQWFRIGKLGFWSAQSEKRLAANPVAWLAGRERWQSLWLWIVTLLLLVGGVAGLWLADSTGLWMVWNFLASAFTLVFYLGFASQAARFFVEARRNGLMELLLATPLRVEQIVRGHWQAMLRMFGLPLAICLALQWLGSYAAQRETWSQVQVTQTGSAGAFSGVVVPPNAMALVLAGIGMVVVLANLTALVWFGMWMGLTSKTTNLATLKTILFVQVLPWLAITFASGLAVPLLLLPQLLSGAGPNSATSMALWLPLVMTVLPAVLSLAKDAFYFTWSRNRLLTQFRDRAVQSLLPVYVAPPILPASDTPPAA